MGDKIAQKRGSIIVVALVVVTLIAALWGSGVLWHISDSLSSQPYKSDRTDITAQVNSDGSLLVTEQRTFTFTSKQTCIRWKHDTLTNNSKISMRSVRVSTLDASGNATASYDLTAVPFQEKWRETDGTDGVGPGEPCYAIDDEYSTVYTYFDAQDATVVYTVDYTVLNGLTVWHDVAELNWTILSSNWPMDSQNVSVSLFLPIPADTTSVSGSNVYAWSHGPQNGLVSVNDSGIVTYQSDCVKQGQWANLRITFPSEWLTNLPDTKEATQYTSIPHLTSIISDEKAWVDTNTNGQIRGNQLDIALLALCLVLLVLSLLIYLVRGRDHEPQDSDEAKELVTSGCLHPAVAARLLRWNHESTDDLEASIERLKQLGAIRTTDDGSALQRVAEFDASDIDPVDDATLDLLFEKIGDGSDELPADFMSAGSKQEKSDLRHTVLAWQKALTQRVAELGYFDGRSFKWQIRLVCVAVALVVAGIAFKIGANSDTLLGASLPTALIMALIANYLPRRTQQGQNIAAALSAATGKSEEETHDHAE